MALAHPSMGDHRLWQHDLFLESDLAAPKQDNYPQGHRPGRHRGRAAGAVVADFPVAVIVGPARPRGDYRTHRGGHRFIVWGVDGYSFDPELRERRRGRPEKSR